MKIPGLKPRGGYRAKVVLPRPGGEDVALTMEPLGLGFQRRLRERGIVPPSPPMRIARDSNGRPVRDESGQAVTIADEQDRGYLDAVEQHHQRVAVLAVAESLAGDANVWFDAQPPTDDEGWCGYADALYREMEEAGFTEGDLVQLCSFACRLSNLSGGHVQGAESGFFSAGGVGTA